jgi:hypothetical protein
MNAADPTVGNIATDRAITKAIMVRTRRIDRLIQLPTHIVCMGMIVKFAFFLDITSLIWLNLFERLQEAAAFSWVGVGHAGSPRLIFVNPH